MLATRSIDLRAAILARHWPLSAFGRQQRSAAKVLDRGGWATRVRCNMVGMEPDSESEPIFLAKLDRTGSPVPGRSGNGCATGGRLQ